MSRAVEARGVVAIRNGEGTRVAALRGLDLAVEAGEVTAIVGPSGSGKTTLLRLLAAGERPAAGSLHAFDVELDRASNAVLRGYRRTVVGIVEQHYRRTLSPYLPALDIVALPLAVRGVSRRQREARAGALLDALGLGDRLDASPHALSGGEQQRVAVAAALAIRPRLLLADEPTGELDAATAAALLRELRELVRAEGVTCVVVTHDEAVEAIADRVVVLRDGRAIAERVGKPVEATRRLVDSLGWLAPPVEVRAAAVASAAPAPDRTAHSDHAAPAVVIEGVRRRFGDARRGIVALDGIDTVIGRTVLHAVTGPSGSGKSTLLRLIAGLEQPDAGRVTVLGQDLAALDRAGRSRFRAVRIGIAEQARGLVPFLDIGENVELSLAIRVGRSARAAGAAAEQALAAVGIGHLAARRPSELSAGERTRAAIARAIAVDPELLLLDEPTATLDRANAIRIAELLHELAERMTVVVATHDPALVDAADTRLDLARAR